MLFLFTQSRELSSEIQNFPKQGAPAPQPGGQPPGTPVIGQQFAPPPPHFPAAGSASAHNSCSNKLRTSFFFFFFLLFWQEAVQ